MQGGGTRVDWVQEEGAFSQAQRALTPSHSQPLPRRSPEDQAVRSYDLGLVRHLAAAG